MNAGLVDHVTHQHRMADRLARTVRDGDIVVADFAVLIADCRTVTECLRVAKEMQRVTDLLTTLGSDVLRKGESL